MGLIKGEGFTIIPSDGIFNVTKELSGVGPVCLKGNLKGSRMRNVMNKEKCPIERAVDLIDGRWTVTILWNLRNGKLRFSDLREKMPGVTHKMLSQQLRHLEENELIERTVFPEVPPRVEYKLTPLGESLKPILQSLNNWGHSLSS